MARPSVGAVPQREKTTLSGAEIHDQVETDSTRLDQIGTVVLLLYINRNA